MVDKGTFDSVWNFLQGSQLLFDLIANLRTYQRRFITLSWECWDKRGKIEKPTHLIKVGDLLQRDFLLFLDGMTHRSLNSLHEEVKGSWVLSTHQSKRSH